MNYSNKVLRTVESLLLMCGLSLSALQGGSNDWRPVTPEELALSEPQVESGAGAEAIFWEIRFEDKVRGRLGQTVESNYVRVKIFDQSGVEAYGTIKIPYLSRTRIRDIKARTIKPDGTIIVLKKDSIFEKVVIKTDGLKVKTKSFAMPGIEPGVIVEYRWKEVHNELTTLFTRLALQRDIPVRALRYYLKPLKVPGYQMLSNAFNGAEVTFTLEEKGWASVTALDVPAFREEPDMPSEWATRAWMLVFYAEAKRMAPEEFWPQFGKGVHKNVKKRLKADGSIRSKAAEIIGDTSDPAEQLRRLYEFCRTQIQNYNDDAYQYDPDVKIKENKSSSDTLKRRIGSGVDINLLFAALASATGFEARYARVGDNADIFFDQRLANGYYLSNNLIAVKVGTSWAFFDPAHRHAPFGMLSWREEGVAALLVDAKNPVFVDTPMSTADRTRVIRKAQLKLSETGTLSGQVQIEYTGHLADRYKESLDEETPQQQEAIAQGMIENLLGDIAIEDLSIENIEAPQAPLLLKCRVTADAYGQAVGRRIIFQPAVFQSNLAPRFPSETRRYPIYFKHAWSESDSVEIEVPEGFVLEKATAPPPLTANNRSYVYQPSIEVEAEGTRLTYRRKFAFASPYMPVENYAKVKNLFDTVHERDHRALILKKKKKTDESGDSN